MTTAIDLGIFASRLSAICDEMGASLQRSAFSPNIKDRLDYSCAIFDVVGGLCAQAAHIPVHLGSMAFAMTDLVQTTCWQQGDILVVNDPYLGGTHLPDVTIVAPVFVGECLQGFVANRAHHANIGATSPGSMPIARCLSEEGVIIAPTILLRDGQWKTSILDALCGEENDVRARGDFYAQVSACQLGGVRLQKLIQKLGESTFAQQLNVLNQYAESLALAEWRTIPNGQYQFTDYMEDDGTGNKNIPISIMLTLNDGYVEADFTGTSAQVSGNINCPLSVAAAGVFYCLRCLLPTYAPACAGTFKPITLKAAQGSLVNAQRPAAVAAGNVETSSRIVDAVFGALAQAIPNRIPAASQGTMNNLAMGSKASEGTGSWDYYETLGGGAGASPKGDGLSSRQTHMTNTLNTPVESIESHYPVRINRYQIRRNSGGEGEHVGGSGVVREFEFLAPAQVSLLTERRTLAPWGLWGAKSGKLGCNLLNNKVIAAKVELKLQAGDRLTLKTPGGGGWNSPAKIR